MEPLKPSAAVANALPLGHRTAAEAPHAEAPNLVAEGKSNTSTRPIIFVKTHKTGSRTMADILLRDCATSNCSVIEPLDGTHLGWPAPFPGRNESNTYGPGRHQFDRILNHAVFNNTAMRAYVKEGPFVLTVIRKPVEQMASAWSYYGGEKGYYPDVPNLSSWDDRIQFLEDARPIRPNNFRDHETVGDPSRFVNSLSHDLGWYQKVDDTSYDDSDNTIENWLGDLEPQLDFVFMTEAYDEGLVLLGRRLGLALPDLMYVMTHVQSDRDSRAIPTDDQLARLEPFLHVDNLLYARFRKRFWRAWNEAGGDAALGEDLKRLRFLNEEVAKACTTYETSDDPCMAEHMKLAKENKWP
jgi:hypothetical protein